MAKKNHKETLKKLRQQAQERAISDISGRISYVRSSIAQRISSFVPVQFRWMIPFLIEELDIKPPTVEDITDRFSRKPEATELSTTSVSEEIAKAEAALGIPASDLHLYPVLSPKTQIRGNRGRYEVESYLGYRGKGRFYQAIALPDRQPVVIKEYLLSKSNLSEAEITKRKESFERLAGIELADGRLQDFRLITAWDAIADPKPSQERCYLAIKNTQYTAPTLGSYISQTGAMTNIEVREVLDQVLQSLQFLHSQKFRLPSGLVKSEMTHGRLSLDSLLIVPNFQGFFIYLCDLALWEDLFITGEIKLGERSIQKDLKDLGKVAFYLLAGSENLEANKEEDWRSTGANFELKKFILKLINSSFDSAEVARQNLPKLSLLSANEFVQDQAKAQQKNQNKWYKSRLLLLSGLGIFLLGLIIWFWASRGRDSEAIASDIDKNSIAEVSGIPNGEFRYTTEPDGIWHYVMNQPKLLPGGKSLEIELQQLAPKLKLKYVRSSSPDVLSTLTTEEMNFVVTSLSDNLNPDLGYKEFAYDGLVFFVAFSKTGRENSLPPALNGKISFEQLRQIYTGKITNWKQLGGPDLAVKLYIPPNDEALQIFEQRVLKTKALIDDFRSLIEQSRQTNQCVNNSSTPINRCQSFQTFRAIIQDFENNKQAIGSIGFDSLTKVFGQCSVYPLALVDGNSPISPLLQKNGKAVTPQTDLCNDKGNYTPNFKDFMNQRYPLAYPLAIVYPRDNRLEPVGEKFADILRTTEIQCLLQETGLIPLHPLELTSKKAIACINLRRRI